ncbi:carbohydrate kinase family protein [bacterium]|jgi:adenosine kinase|nr:carbohydrate kinase family protein [bacterium]
MKRNIFLFGSLAYDNIITYDGFFKELIDSDIERSYNFSFLSTNVIKEYGGCAGNIAYNLKLIQESSNIVSSLGSDGNEYFEKLKNNNISIKYIKKYNDNLTAQAHIITDKSNNQITSFYQGVLGNKYDLSTLNIKKDDIAIVSPDNIENMKEYIHFLDKNKIKFIFDPGQVIGLFTEQELINFLKLSYFTIVNDYEFDILKNTIKLSEKELISTYNFIITKGDKGSISYLDKEEFIIPAYKPDQVVDSTGCGDSFRAGLLYGILNNFSPIEYCKIGASLASFNVEQNGTQNHFCGLKDIQKRMNSCEL